jgi:hypothetical protein
MDQQQHTRLILIVKVQVDLQSTLWSTVWQYHLSIAS